MSRLQPRLEILRQIESVQTKLERLTVCSCGAPVLPDHINIGTEYIVFPATEVDDGYWFITQACRDRHEQARWS
jgi:hypothetical protein